MLAAVFSVNAYRKFFFFFVLKTHPTPWARVPPTFHPILRFISIYRMEPNVEQNNDSHCRRFHTRCYQRIRPKGSSPAGSNYGKLACGVSKHTPSNSFCCSHMRITRLPLLQLDFHQPRTKHFLARRDRESSNHRVVFSVDQPNPRMSQRSIL